MKEGPYTKGGHNPPNTSNLRPPAPKGSGGPRLHSASALVELWRGRALASREEAIRIRATVHNSTDAEERCNVRAEVWEWCASELEAVLIKGAN